MSSVWHLHILPNFRRSRSGGGTTESLRRTNESWVTTLKWNVNVGTDREWRVKGCLRDWWRQVRTDRSQTTSRPLMTHSGTQHSLLGRDSRLGCKRVGPVESWKAVPLGSGLGWDGREYGSSKGRSGWGTEVQGRDGGPSWPRSICWRGTDSREETLCLVLS